MNSSASHRPTIIIVLHVGHQVFQTTCHFFMFFGFTHNQISFGLNSKGQSLTHLLYLYYLISSTVCQVFSVLSFGVNVMAAGRSFLCCMLTPPRSYQWVYISMSRAVFTSFFPHSSLTIIQIHGMFVKSFLSFCELFYNHRNR
jgi:hypothetical protein